MITRATSGAAPALRAAWRHRAPLVLRAALRRRLALGAEDHRIWLHPRHGALQARDDARRPDPWTDPSPTDARETGPVLASDHEAVLLDDLTDAVHDANALASEVLALLEDRRAVRP